MNSRQTDILIIGAGPTGLMAACQLARFGTDFIIIDHKDGPTQQSRAIAVTSRSLEIYQQMGLIYEILRDGQPLKSFSMYSKGKRQGEVVLGVIGNGLSEFNYFMTYEQSKNEELLYRHLMSMGQNVMWNTGFVFLTHHTENVSVIVSSHGEQQTIKASYVIACDGASSPVRHQLNMNFIGGTYENKFYVADTILKWNEGYDRLAVFPGDKNFAGFFPMKGNSNYRVIGTLPVEYFQEENISFTDIEQSIRETIKIPVTFEKVNWFSIYKLHHRRIESFNVGRVFLAGDAAHIHSPAGGQGMNTGLQDAYNLAWKLSFVMKGYTSPKILDTYNEERLPFAKWLMSFTDRGFNVLTSDHWMINFVRKNIVLRLIGSVLRIKWIRPVIFRTISQIWYSYKDMSLSRTATTQKLKFHAGDRFPYVLNDDGTSIYHYLKGPSFHLVHLTGNTSHEHMSAHNPTVNYPVRIFSLPITEGWQKLGVKNDLFILVRPDNYILSISDTLDLRLTSDE